ncbi:hypothetical protein HGT73_14345 [Rosenbergiella australiborealis]|uniref:CdiI C-terminal domain-containing protein n=1 Tax=Rosenbergiella australiborealis TaxID=1544696 RepID=A0ABS5TAS6_9GAMM|nr:hypothetical protein [Rosenbergiella australiborealis]MBT0728522.1 hypothetical protein [Rosenbergiella australiborealis]
MFGIFPIDGLVEINDELVLPCSIIVGGFVETLHIPVSYWSFEDYKTSWMKSLEYGIEKNKYSALAVTMYEPELTNFIFTWVLYFCGDIVYVQNKILFLDEYPGFNPGNINNFISSREIYSEEGVKISEWKTDLKSVVAFYNSLKGC